jgi:deoxyribodipyrimidine photolyase-related protein
MILGNFMLLCEIHPNAVYQWFMEFYIDAYDWVMVPNVYGMSQFADGGYMCTKPYISSSNYILKMSDYKKGAWCDIWDGLYWRFVTKHREFLSKNIRFKMIISQLDKMNPERKAFLFEQAENFLVKLHTPK